MSVDSSTTAIRFAFEAVVAVPAEVAVSAFPVKGPLNDVAVTTPVATIPDLAVIRPTESILVTSSYVNVPPILTSPLTFSEVKVPREVIFDCAGVVTLPVKLAYTSVI